MLMRYLTVDSTVYFRTYMFVDFPHCEHLSIFSDSSKIKKTPVIFDENLGNWK